MGFLVFILVNAALFIRPGEIIPDLQEIQIYNYVIIFCFAISFPSVLKLLSGRSLVRDPITVCVLGVQVGVLLSHLSHMQTWEARNYGFEFFKVVLYYLLLVGLTDTTARLRTLLLSLIGFAAIITILPLLNFHGVISIPSLDPLERLDTNSSGEVVGSLMQLRGSGIFNDPNDFCFFLALISVFVLYFWTDSRLRLFRLIGPALLGLFGYAIVLTRSRGGFLAMVAGVLLFLVSRFGGRRAILLAGLAMPVILIVFAGRQTAISTQEETAQSRMQLWSESLYILQRYPVFGRGMNMLVDEIGQVAHNSFVHTFAELGFFGGTAFLGAFFIPLRQLYGLRSRQDQISDPEVRRLRHYLLAALTAYTVGLMTLSRCYKVPTYMVIGVANAYLRNPAVAPLMPDFRVTPRLIQWMIMFSFGFLMVIYLFVRVFVRWG